MTLNVRNFGAVGTGNDTTTFQAAMDAASAAATRLYVPAGTYFVRLLEHKSNVTMVGDGQGATILKLPNAASAGSHVIQTSSAAANMGLERLTIDGNKATQTQASLQGANYRLVDGLGIEAVEFRNCVAQGLVIQQASRNYVVERCWSHHNGAGGFYEQNNSGANLLSRYVACLSEENGWGGFNSFSCDYVLYKGCIARANVQDQASFPTSAAEFGSDSGRRMTYEGCMSIDSLGGGFSLYSNIVPGPPASAETVKYIGCTAYNAQEFGFIVRNCLDVSIVGCTAQKCGREGTGSVAGIHVQTTDGTLRSKRWLIDGCTVTDNGREGIHIQGAQNGTISNCVIMNNSDVVGSQPGIRIDQMVASSAQQSHSIVIEGNRIGDDQGSPTQVRAIIFMNGTNKVTVRDNDLRDNVQADPIGYTTFTGSDLRFSNNAGMPLTVQASAATFDPEPELDTIEVSGSTNITTLGTTHAYPGRRIRLRFTGTAELIHGNNIHLDAGANFAPASAHEMIELETDGTDYRELTRSANT